MTLLIKQIQSFLRDGSLEITRGVEKKDATMRKFAKIKTAESKKILQLTTLRRLLECINLESQVVLNRFL